MKFNYREEPLHKNHNRQIFDCGNEELNLFFKYYARQYHQKGTAKTYVTIDGKTEKIIGFYTITLASIEYEKCPKVFRKRLSHHPIPLFTLAHLAVDITEQNQGIGGMLLFKAIERCSKVAKEVGGIGVLIDAKNEHIAKWYRQFGAKALPDQPLSLILPFSVIENL